MYPLKVENYLCVERGVFSRPPQLNALVLFGYPIARDKAVFEAAIFLPMRNVGLPTHVRQKFNANLNLSVLLQVYRGHSTKTWRFFQKCKCSITSRMNNTSNTASFVIVVHSRISVLIKI